MGLFVMFGVVEGLPMLRANRSLYSWCGSRPFNIAVPREAKANSSIESVARRKYITSFGDTAQLLSHVKKEKR
ncbi:hypothetical protein ACHQM5_024897 [Ranunculus cassubicifolius]